MLKWRCVHEHDVSATFALKSVTWYIVEIAKSWNNEIVKSWNTKDCNGDMLEFLVVILRRFMCVSLLTFTWATWNHIHIYTYIYIYIYIYIYVYIYIYIYVCIWHHDIYIIYHIYTSRVKTSRVKTCDSSPSRERHHVTTTCDALPWYVFFCWMTIFGNYTQKWGIVHMCTIPHFCV